MNANGCTILFCAFRRPIEMCSVSLYNSSCNITIYFLCLYKTPSTYVVSVDRVNCQGIAGFAILLVSAIEYYRILIIAFRPRDLNENENNV